MDLQGVNLSYANLENAKFVQTNLNRANLCEADLVDANFYRSTLVDANLSSSCLNGSNFEGADFTRANLGRSLIMDANFKFANLEAAVFCGAQLMQTDFCDNRICGADFRNVIFGENSLVDIDLSEVVGLDDVDHHYPSSVGIDTILRSNGKVPELFLRGCGVPESLITYLPSLTNNAIDFYRCFISYSHADKVFARRLHDALQGRGIRCWLDEHQLLPGHDIHDAIDRGIRLWDKVILCASEHSLTSWWCDGEISKAFAKEAQLMKERGKKVLALIPLNLDGYLFKWENGKAAEVKTRMAANFEGWEKDNSIFETQFERLVKALQTSDPLGPPPTPKL